VITTVLVLAAAAGAAVIFLGVSQGSFGRGGQLVDQNIANATATAMDAVHNTANGAGDALQSAGQRLKQTAGSNG
jgi:predicted small secreted protein